MPNTQPPDVPAYVDTTTSISYASGTDLPTVGDGVGARGSTMPIIASQLDEVATPTDLAATWIDTGGQADTIPDLALNEAKFRSLGNFSHMGYDDPIRHYGEPGESHLHTFFGNRTVNAYSTFASLRTQANARAAVSKVASTVAGGPINGTGYWLPTFTKDIGGTDYAIPMSHAIIYYASNPATLSQYTQRLPRGLRYITGCNMDDPDDLIVKAEIAAANAQPGTSGRYTYRGNGFNGYIAYASDRTTIIQTADSEDYSPFIKDTDNTDPWDGALSAGGWFKLSFDAPFAYDGRNLWSPGGYKHFRHAVDDAQGGIGIPEGWYAVPQAAITIWIQHKGFSDYGTWTLASDAHGSMTAGRTLPTGFTAHLDWFGAWNEPQFDTATGWMGDCLGADGITPHTCDNSTFETELNHLIGGYIGENAPDGTRSPQCPIPVLYDNDTPAELIQVPASTTGSFSASGIAT